MERKMLNVKLTDRIRNTIIRQRIKGTDIIQSVTNMKWKWAGHEQKIIDGLFETQSGR